MSNITMGDLVNIRTGKLDANAAVKDGKYPFFTTAKEISRIDNFSYEGEVVLVAGNGDLNVKYYHGKFDAYQRTYILSAKNDTELDMKYLYYFFENYLKVLRSQSIGGVIKYIKLENLTTPKVYFPSIKKQKRIADTLDLASELIEKRKEQIAEMEKLERSYFFKMFFKGKKHFEEKKIMEIVTSIDGGWSPKASNEKASNNEKAVLKLSAITKGKYQYSENKKLFDETQLKENIIVKKGDLLFSRKNTLNLVGITAYVYDTPDNLMFPDTIFRLNIEDKLIHPIYLSYLLNFSLYRENVQALAGGSSGSMPNISKANLKKLEIIVPPLELQNKFASIVEEIESQKKAMEESLHEMENNFNSLMQKAFRGELFPEE